MESRPLPPASRARAALRTPAAVTALVVVGAWTVAALTPRGLVHGYAAFVGTLIPAVLLAVAWHEGGHFAAGRLLGFEAVAVTIGPVHVHRARRGWRVRSVRGWPRSGGSVSCLPTRERTARRDWMLMVAAGPAASILVPLLLYALWLGSAGAIAAAGPPGRLTSAVLSVLANASVLSFVLGFLNLVPMRVGGAFSDGAQLRLLAAGGVEATRYLALMLLLAAGRRGARPRAWRDDWMAAVTAPTAPAARLDARTVAWQSLGWCLRYYRALDRGDAAAAGEALERALSLGAGLSAGHRAIIYLDAAYFEARVRGNAGAARAYLHAARGADVPRAALLKAEAALLLLEGDAGGAAARAEAGLRALADAEESQNLRLPMQGELLRELADRASCMVHRASSPDDAADGMTLPPGQPATR